jgi:hypothetical protein
MLSTCMKGFLWRHKTLLVIWVAVFGIGGYLGYILLSASGSGGENPYTLSSTSNNQSPSPEQPASNQPKQAKVGQAAKDGDLEFTVTSSKCNGETSIGSTYARAESEGTFCRLSISIKNQGSKATSLPLSAQKAFVDEDNPLAVEVDATQYAQADQAKGYWYDQIAPGKTVSGDLIFSVNGKEEPILAELHGTENSPGLKVTLK